MELPYFAANSPDECCLCGSKGPLSGEHKIKGSLLRKVFQKDPLIIGSFESNNKLRHAQGSRSKNLHFSFKLCVLCNSGTTQEADRTFDEFHNTVIADHQSGKDLGAIFETPSYAIGKKKYLSVFRYFGKILCCQIADGGGPKPLDICAFVLGFSDHNYIRLQIKEEDCYGPFGLTAPPFNFVSHGGLQCHFDKLSLIPNGLFSSLTIENIHYRFGVEFDSEIGEELLERFPSFYYKCLLSYKTALQEELTRLSQSVP